MKRKNFPGRVMQRRIDAAMRAAGKSRPYTEQEVKDMEYASTQRSKRSLR